MTTLREAAQQALEALIRASSYYDTYAEIATLEAALAQEQAEPVAWMDIDSDGQRLTVRQWSDGNRDEVPLYPAPPQRKPLTEAQIYAAIKGIDSLKAVEVARAVERAHGITGPEDRSR